MTRCNPAIRLLGICRFIGWMVVTFLFIASVFALTVATLSLFAVAI